MHRKPVFEIGRDKSVKVYLHMYNGNVQQNSLCVESFVTKEFSISPQFSPTILISMQIQYSYEHTFVQQETMRRKSCVQNCSRERKGLYNRNVQQNPLCAASCH